jgi:ribosome-associated protein
MKKGRPDINLIKDEVRVETTRSGGPGGQHVNKVETKVILRWSIENSQVISDLEKVIIRKANKNRINKDAEIIVSAGNKRSQLRNKEIAYKKLDRILAKSFVRKKARIKTSPTKQSKLKRLNDKKKNSETKALRKKIL